MNYGMYRDQRKEVLMKTYQVFACVVIFLSILGGILNGATPHMNLKDFPDLVDDLDDNYVNTLIRDGMWKVFIKDVPQNNPELLKRYLRLLSIAYTEMNSSTYSIDYIVDQQDIYIKNNKNLAKLPTKNGLFYRFARWDSIHERVGSGYYRLILDIDEEKDRLRKKQNPNLRTSADGDLDAVTEDEIKLNIARMEKEACDYAEEIVKQYKIHFMPREDYSSPHKNMCEVERIFIKILKTFKKNSTLNDCVTSIKIKLDHIYEIKTLADWYPIEELERLGLNPHQTISQFPRIVLYIYGKENAQTALDILFDVFKDEQGSGKLPGHNDPVTSLLSVAQGDRDWKEDPCLAKFYEEGKVYYRADITGKVQNYHLKNPNKK